MQHTHVRYNRIHRGFCTLVHAFVFLVGCAYCSFPVKVLSASVCSLEVAWPYIIVLYCSRISL